MTLSMTDKNAFAQEVVEALAAFGTVSARPMFGAHGLFHQGLMMGIVEEGQLFFKVNAETQAHYEAAGCRPFTYSGPEGKSMTLGYWTIPAEVFEQPPVLAEWAREAFQVALAAKVARAKSGQGKSDKSPSGQDASEKRPSTKRKSSRAKSSPAA